MVSKQHIIDEIRRTADVNGGKPLGRNRFHKETGVVLNDWHGRYWTAWGAALEDAGFAPNQLQEAYDEPHLLELLGDFILELGKYPTHAEIKMRSQNDETFPSVGTFQRLGTKPVRARKLIDHLQCCDGYEQVVEICIPIAADAPNEYATPELDIEFHFVYLVKSGRYYKIGYTNSLGRREYEIRLKLPEDLKLIHAIKTDDPTGIEAYWHNRFKDKRKNGEWFDLEQSDVSAFKRRTFM